MVRPKPLECSSVSSGIKTAASRGYSYLGGKGVPSLYGNRAGHVISGQTPRGGFDGPMAAPWRKTVSIFKQPVTLVRTTSRGTKQPPQNELSNIKGGKIDKPKQIFWAKRLESLRALIPLSSATSNADNGFDTDTVVESLSLPTRIQPVGPIIKEEVAMGSLCSALQTPSGTQIMGQTNPKAKLDSNPGVYINCDQPLIQAIVVHDSDLLAQEKRVLNARARLEETRKHFPR